MDGEFVAKEPDFLHRALYSGPLGRAASAALVISAILFLIWLVLVIRRRRLLPLLGGTAVILAIVSHLYLDWWHISLNLAMRDAQRVRDDCERMLKFRTSTVESESMELHLPRSSPEFPSSFARLGAKEIVITPEVVVISLHSDWDGGAYGFLYNPHHSTRTYGTPLIRPTWFRDFYDFRLGGE